MIKNILIKFILILCVPIISVKEMATTIYHIIFKFNPDKNYE